MVDQEQQQVHENSLALFFTWLQSVKSIHSGTKNVIHIEFTKVIRHKF